MANPLFQQFGNQMPGNNIMNQFEQFRKNFKGNPQQIVQQLLASGQMSQAQFNQLKQMADQFMRNMPR